MSNPSNVNRLGNIRIIPEYGFS
ncbi:hypothetical protein RHIZ404_201005 [Rhizobium sp. EC-SD404]|nr:hypothetical protein RHIZ404_201005 [Rhizobium sp. EC-SD404]